MIDNYPAAVKRLKPADYHSLIVAALREDHVTGDLSTRAIFTKPEKCKARIIAKQEGTLAGLEVAKACFKHLDNKLRLISTPKDGKGLKRGAEVLRIEGNVQSVLRAERVALNFLGMLSGIATKTKRLSSRLAKYKIGLLDTRKTIPGFRILSKYAVTIGGGRNHRLHLADMGMIKENHITQAGGVSEALGKYRKKFPKLKIELEVETFKQLQEALPHRPDIVLLDNMTPAQLKKCTRLIKDHNKKHHTRIGSEASGGFTEQNLGKLKGTGVDFVSMGALTNTIAPFDFSLLIDR